MNRILESIPQSITLKIADQARALESEGQNLLKLQTGDPDFSPPAEVIDALNSAIFQGKTHYSDTKGEHALREAISGYIWRSRKIQYDPLSEVLIGNGGVHAVFCAINTLISPGDEVIILDPSWMPYTSCTMMAGGKPIRIPTDPDKGFLPNLEIIQKAISPRTRLIVLNSPGNPSGQVYSSDFLHGVSELCKKYDLFVLSDEVYSDLVYVDDEFQSVSAMEGMRDRSLIVHSFSKTFAMTGFRIGYLLGPKKVISLARKICQYSITHVAPFIQEAALKAIESESVWGTVDEMRKTYQKRRDSILRQYIDGNASFRLYKPGGAFYFMLDLRKTGKSSADLSSEILEHTKVVTVPGSGFGQCADGFVRISFASELNVVKKALSRINEYYSKDT